MDAKALSAAAGIDVGTLNAWISRGYLPGVTADAQGRRRDFGLPTTTHVAIIAELVRLGISALTAARAAHVVHHSPLGWGTLDDQMNPIVLDKGRLILVPAYAVTEQQRAHMARVEQARLEHGGARVPVDSFPFLPLYLNTPDIPNHILWHDGEPTSHIVINIERLTEKMRAAQEEWEQRQKKLPSKRSARTANG